MSERIRPAGLAGLLIILIGAVFLVSGLATWAVVQHQLGDEHITVHEDSARFGGQPVDGPFTAYAQAQVVEKHALAATQGKTYGELERDNPVRATAETASFVRASLMTSVLAFGVSALVMGLGAVTVLVGLALRRITIPAVPQNRGAA